ncbi:hypothetical protein BDN70DRAFT_936298 [Pholiota conissans]|uniref:F-box domain-containing protein n=1 Tax=Pholiota conissans TaxID=109636 RepID=A0A9P6CVN7_9AGAR|nr:hypothetical protein BDN70DRAFT_936298 [Pholiota conissans]
MDFSLASIESLPNELLSDIFEKAVVTVPKSGISPFLVIPQSNITTIGVLSQVSRRWNEIIYSTKQLWASAIDMDSDNVSKLETIVRRAGTAPLVINSSNVDQDFSKETWRFVLARLATWGIFYLETSAMSDKSSLTGALAQPAPQLRAFSIHNTRYHMPPGMNNILTEPDHFLLPHNLFAGHAPCLREVSIANVYFPLSFDFLVWERLTMLHVQHDLEGDEDDVLYSSRWLQVLAKMPLLEALYLEWELSRSAKSIPVFISSSEHESVSDVHMSHLRKLEFSAPAEGSNILLSILAKLIVPNACCTAITVALDDDVQLLRYDLLRASANRRAKEWRSVGARLEINSWNFPMAIEFGFDIRAPTVGKGAMLDVRCIGLLEESSSYSNDASTKSNRGNCPFAEMMLILKEIPQD